VASPPWRQAGAELVRLLGGRPPSRDEHEAIRLRRLRSLLAYASRHVPYYRELFRDAHLTPDDIRGVADLTLIPVTDRERLRAAGRGRTSDRVHAEDCRVRYSSGWSGEPWPVYRTHAEEGLQRALELRSMIHAGVKPRDRIAALGPVVGARKHVLGRVGLFRTHFVSPLLPIREQAAQLGAIRPDVFWV